MPELARAPCGVGAADAAVDRHDDVHAFGVQALERRGLQAVAVAQALRNEVHDVGAEQLQGAAQDHRRGDAIDVVVAVHGNAFVLSDRAHQPIDGGAHIRQAHRIEQVVERRVEGTVRHRRALPRPRMASSRAAIGEIFSSRASAAAHCFVTSVRFPDQRGRHGKGCNRSTGDGTLGPRRCRPIPSSGTSDSAARAASRRRAAADARSARSSAVSSMAAACAVVVVRAAHRFGHDFVDDAEAEQVGRRELQRVGRFDLACRVAPQDRGAAFRRNHAIDRELVHQDAIADGDAEGAAAAAFAVDDDDRPGRGASTFRAG